MGRHVYKEATSDSPREKKARDQCVTWFTSRSLLNYEKRVEYVNKEPAL